MRRFPKAVTGREFGLALVEGSITVISEKGPVRVGGFAVNEIQHIRLAELDSHDGEMKSARFETSSLHGFGHPIYVMSVLRGEPGHAFDERQGLTSLEVLIVACISARH